MDSVPAEGQNYEQVEEERSTDEGMPEPPQTLVDTKPRLIVKRDGIETDVIFAVNPPATIGRFDPSVGPIDIDLGGIPEGAYVSRKHARITFEEGAWKIADLGSSNGTWKLGESDFEKVEEVELRDGDEIALGNAKFIFRAPTAPVEPVGTAIESIEEE